MEKKSLVKQKKDGKSALDPLPVIRATHPGGVETCPTRERKKKKISTIWRKDATSNNLMNIIQNISEYIPRLVCIQTAARACVKSVDTLGPSRATTIEKLGFSHIEAQEE